jgi:hypothetical protein
LAQVRRDPDKFFVARQTLLRNSTNLFELSSSSAFGAIIVGVLVIKLKKSRMVGVLV